MDPRQRQRILGIALAVVVAGSGLYLVQREPTATVARRASPAKGQTKPPVGQEAPPDVRLEELNATRSWPVDASRNLFQFRERALPPQPQPPPPPPPPVLPRPGTPPMASVPSGPPALPPIPLKFAGVLTQGPIKIAVLLDSLGHAIYGKEGESIEGRYRILRISVESIEMSYLDGRGRQSIRMSGT